LYHYTPGTFCTKYAFQTALKRAAELHLKHIVVASCSGKSALLFLNHTSDFEVVCVSHQVGYFKQGETEMDPETRKRLTNAGIKILTSTHLLAGIDRACRIKFGGVYPAELVASTLRMFGQGVKVCVEISVMALDAGLIPFGTEIVALGGSGNGLDSAVVLTPAHSQNFFDTKIKEVSSPGEFHPEALSEPDVNLSAHPAPIIQPQDESPFASVRTASVRV